MSHIKGGGRGREVTEGIKERMIRRKLLVEGKEEEEEGRKALSRALLVIRDTVSQEQEESALPLKRLML